jgi:hypothetical protein
MTEAGFSIEGAQQELVEFKRSLAGVVPDPTSYRVLELNKEYSPQEIKTELQKISSYLAYLYGMTGNFGAENIVVSKGFKRGLSVARLDPSLSGTTLAEKDAQLIAKVPEFAKYAKEEILAEAYLEIIKGWAKAYEAAYTGASRMLSADEAEASATSSRTP